ncbi:MAG: hypothetical protein R3F19_10130 [Verrucomicrobiales bacterium]
MPQLLRKMHTLGELVGLALRDTNKCGVEIDLIPESVQRQRDLDKKKPYLFTAAACLLGRWLPS